MYNFNSRGDLADYIQNNLLDMSLVTKELDCSRQNVHDLIKRGKLTPIKIGKNNLFFKEDIEARKPTR